MKTETETLVEFVRLVMRMRRLQDKYRAEKRRVPGSTAHRELDAAVAAEKEVDSEAATILSGAKPSLFDPLSATDVPAISE